MMTTTTPFIRWRLRPLLHVQVQLLLAPDPIFFFLLLSLLLFSGFTCSALFAVVSKPARHHQGLLLFFLPQSCQYGRLPQQQPQHYSTAARPFSRCFSSSLDDDQNDGVDPRKEFLETMERLKFADGNNGDFRQQRKPQQNDPLMGYRPEQLEAFAELLSGSSQLPRDSNDSSRSNSNANTETPTTEDMDQSDGALFRNDDFYVRSREYLNLDYSIRQQQQSDSDDSDTNAVKEALLDDSTIMDQKYREALQNYLETVVTSPAPEAYDSSADSAATVDDLWSFLGQRGVPTFDPVAAEALHRQVFAEEEGHLQQSEAFRASLIDSTVAKQVAAERRGRNFRERQDEEIRELDQQIREFEATTLPKLGKSAPSLPAIPRARQQQQQQSSNLDGAYAELLPPLRSSSSRKKHPLSDASSQSVKSASGSSSEPQHQQRRHQRASVPSSMMRANHTIPASSQRSDSGSFQRTTSNNAATATLSGSQAAQGKGPWREVVDPDTNEVFYWNEVTEEMRWELEELSDG